MKRLFPSPYLSVALFVLWLLLMQSVSAGTLMLGVLLSIFWPIVTAQLRPASVRIRHPFRLFLLLCRVVREMLKSNWEVGRAILTRRSRDVRSGFMQMPLQLQDRNGLALLAMIITATPGTAWAQLSADRRTLLIHVLEIESEAALMKLFRERYERTLMEVFE